MPRDSLARLIKTMTIRGGVWFTPPTKLNPIGLIDL